MLAPLVASTHPDESSTCVKPHARAHSMAICRSRWATATMPRARSSARRRSSGAPTTTARARRPAEIPAERTLVRVMMSWPGFAERGAREVEASLLRHPWYARIFELLARGEKNPPEDLLEPWYELAQPEPPPFDPESEFAGAVQWIKDRPRLERLAQIERDIELADGARKDELFKERMELINAGPRRQQRKAFKAAREPKY